MNKPILKSCNCTECEGYHEGHCAMGVLYPNFNLWSCSAKSNDDLMTKEEYVKKHGYHPNFDWID
jgi:hypothetical protein